MSSKKRYVIEVSPDNLGENPRNEWDQVGTLFTGHPRYLLGGSQDQNNRKPPDDYREWVFTNIYAKGEGPRLDSRFEPFEYDDYGNAAWYPSGPVLWEYQRLCDFSTKGTLRGPLLDRFEELSAWVEAEEASEEETAAFYAAFDEWIEQNVCIRDVYLYDHSGLSVRCSPFSCGWDSGQVGFIYVTRSKCDTEGIDFEEAGKVLEWEIETLDQYLTGDVWCFSSGFSEYDEELDLTPDYEDENIEVYIIDSYIGVPDELEDFEFGEHQDSCGGFYGRDYLMQHLKEELVPGVARVEKERVAEEKLKLHKQYWCM